MMSMLINKVKRLPDSPGVYLFKKRVAVLYIGKATSLRSRVRSYFRGDLIDTRGPLLVKMINEADNIDFKKTGSVLEALLLEAELIRKFKPPYNTDGKDDKSDNCVCLTDEEFPRLLVVRKRDLDFPTFLLPSLSFPRKRESRDLSLDPRVREDDRKITPKTVFGPFPHGNELREALKIIRRIFPWRDKKCEPNQGRPCFNRQIGLCPGVCTGEISAKEYGKIIRSIKLLFQGKTKSLTRTLEREMKALAKNQEFEKADAVKRRLFALKHIQDISLLKRETGAAPQGLGAAQNQELRIEAYDLAHMSGANIVGAMTVIQNGEPDKNSYRKFKIKTVFGPNEPAGIQEILGRRLRHPEWPFPNLIVVDGNEVQKRTAEKVLQKFGKKIPVVAVTKDNRHNPKEIVGDKNLVVAHKHAILLANSEAHRFAIGYHRLLRGRI